MPGPTLKALSYPISAGSLLVHASGLQLCLPSSSSLSLAADPVLQLNRENLVTPSHSAHSICLSAPGFPDAVPAAS